MKPSVCFVGFVGFVFHLAIAVSNLPPSSSPRPPSPAPRRGEEGGGRGEWVWVLF